MTSPGASLSGLSARQWSLPSYIHMSGSRRLMSGPRRGAGCVASQRQSGRLETLIAPGAVLGELGGEIGRALGELVDRAFEGCAVGGRHRFPQAGGGKARARG